MYISINIKAANKFIFMRGTLSDNIFIDLAAFDKDILEVFLIVLYI